MTKIIGVILLSFLWTSVSSAQTAVGKYKKGIYKDFNQLKSDTPLANSACEVYIKSEGMYTEYIIYDSITGERIKQPVYAYSDGDTLFLCRKLYNKGNNLFSKALEIGRFLYFEDLYTHSDFTTNAPIITAAGLVVGALAGGLLFIVPLDNGKVADNGLKSGKVNGIIFDTQTGRLFGLTEENKDEMLKNFPDVLAEFNASAKKKEDVRRMVRLLNRS